MGGTWHGLTNQPGFNTSTMILLTDGRVMVQEEATAHWHALTPDDTGSYLNGTWSTLTDMSFWRRYYSSGVLKDGRVIVVGGEQSGDVGDTNKGEIYDPVADVWSPIAAPPWVSIGDGACCMLPDGRLMIGNLDDGSCIAYDPASDHWDTLGSAAGRTNEETWILLPDDTIITAQTFSPFQSEKYVISSGHWQNEGSPSVTLVDSVMNEIGPAMLTYQGTVIFFGAADGGGHGNTAIYTPAATPTGTGTWSAGPDIPQVNQTTVVCNDCPATLLPNGKVLFAAAPFEDNNWGSPVYFFEYDPVANSITQVATPPNNASGPYAGDARLFWSRMMLLPSGEVLFSLSSNNVQLYEPDSGPQAAWRPGITSITPTGGYLNSNQFTLLGTQLLGLSQANIYGDDCYPATNYPLVRLQDGSGHVYYARTFNFSTLGVSAAGAMQSCEFSVAHVPAGNYQAYVVANGIASLPVPLSVTHWHKPQIIDSGLKREFDVIRKEIFEGDPWNQWQWLGDPEEINALRREVHSLGNEVKRLATMISARALPEVGKEIAHDARLAEKAENGHRTPVEHT